LPSGILIKIAEDLYQKSKSDPYRGSWHDSNVKVPKLGLRTTGLEEVDSFKVRTLIWLRDTQLTWY
jgi:hypothetical protein